MFTSMTKNTISAITLIVLVPIDFVGLVWISWLASPYFLGSVVLLVLLGLLYRFVLKPAIEWLGSKKTGPQQAAPPKQEKGKAK